MIGSKDTSMTTFNILIILLLTIFVGCPTEEHVEQAPVRAESNHVVRKGENLETILSRALPSELSISIINALKCAGFPFRRCIPGDTVTIQEEDGGFLTFTYSQNRTDKYYVINDNQYLSVAMKLPYIDTVSCFLKGEVNSTLYESILKLSETPVLVYRYADIFAWEIDFVTETQNGDSFYISFSKTLCDSSFVEYLDITAVRYKGDIGDYYGVYYCDPEGNEDYYNLKGQSLRKSLLKSPLRYSYISSYFSKRRYHPILKVWRPHHGLDYCAPIGTPVSSIGDGVVTYKGWKGGYGNLIEIRHKNGFKTRYGHLKTFAKGIHKGAKVKMGQLIGSVGSTGLSTGPHLHFEMHKNGVPINPLRVQIPRAPSVKDKYMAEFKRRCDSLIQIIENPVQEKEKGAS